MTMRFGPPWHPRTPAARPLPPRRRALTPPPDLPSPAPSKQIYTHDQVQCAFLTNLPYETREQIYREILAPPGRTLHVSINHRRRGDAALHLDILRTCRRIYAEAIPVFYKHTTLTTNSSYTITHLRSSIRTHHLQ
ncbi:hypothetical protein BJX70DRAFT_357473 [Aspergillus crustosus]